MRRSPALPYLAWALIVAAIVLVGQPGFSYCAGLHPRLCANALLADLAAPWDPGQGTLILAMLAIGWTVIAAARGLGRNTGIAFAALAILVGVPMLFLGPEIPTCLGPLGITPDQCRAAWGLAPQTNWDRMIGGPGSWITILVGAWLVILAATTWRRRQRGGL